MVGAIQKRTVTVNNHDLVCLVAGDPQRTPVLMIHGWAHHPGVWRTTMEALSSRYYCVAVGVLGFAESDRPTDGDYRIAAHGRDTLRIADALDIDRFILLGQSRGGQIALGIAARLAPQRVIKLVDVSGVASGRVGWYLRYVFGAGIRIGYVLPAFYVLLRLVWSVDLFARALYGPYFFDWRRQPAGLARRDGSSAFKNGAHHANWRAMQSMRSTNLLSELHRVQAPTLVIFGKQDHIVPPSEAQAAAEHIPDAKLVLLDRCGHYPMVDRPDAYLNSLRAFLEVEKHAGPSP